jgi:hypothetical protein
LCGVKQVNGWVTKAAQKLRAGLRRFEQDLRARWRNLFKTRGFLHWHVLCVEEVTRGHTPKRGRYNSNKKR